jgi:hypothetical protein
MYTKLETHARFTRNSFGFCLRLSTLLSISVTKHLAMLTYVIGMYFDYYVEYIHKLCEQD